MKTNISRHNQKCVKNKPKNLNLNQAVNCTWVCGPCALAGGCLVKKVVYRATVEETNGKTSTYTRVTENRFKDRSDGHRSSFTNEDHPNPNTLSTHVWDLKQRDQNYEIKWSIVDRASDFNPTTRKCRLCLKEKFYIIFQPEGATLNRRSELFTTCRHRLRLTLANTKEDDFL